MPRQSVLIRSRRAFVVSVGTLIVSVGCHHSASPSPVSACPAGVVSKGSISAMIDGVAWTAACVTNAARQLDSSSIAVGGLDTALDSGRAQGLFFVVQTPPATPPALLLPGTYQIGPLSPSYAALGIYCKPGQVLADAVPCSQWGAVGSSGSGTIVISTLTATSASGTFSFILPPVRDTAASGTRVVANGVFAVTF